MSTVVAPGVVHETFRRTVGSDSVNVFVLRADLSNPRVHTDLLYPGVVAKRERISDLATRSRAVGGINGDFFDIDRTNAPNGMAIANGEFVKSPDVFIRTAGVGTDGVGRLANAGFTSSISLPSVTRSLSGGFNRAVLPANSLGLYNSRWGDTNRAAVTRNDANPRTAVVVDGEVTEVRSGGRPGPIPANGFELVGSGTGAATGGAQLAALRVGDRVSARYSPTFTPAPPSPYRFVVAGDQYLVRGGEVQVTGQQVPFYPRSGIGFSRDGREMVLALVDGRQLNSTGITNTQDFARLLSDLGAFDALQLDGGGSATMVVREPPAPAARVVNSPSDDVEGRVGPGTERAVANGIGIFVDEAPAPVVPEAPSIALLPVAAFALVLMTVVFRRGQTSTRLTHYSG